MSEIYACDYLDAFFKKEIFSNVKYLSEKWQQLHLLIMLNYLYQSKSFIFTQEYTLDTNNTWVYYIVLIIPDLIVDHDVSVNITMFPSHSEYRSRFPKIQMYYTFSNTLWNPCVAFYVCHFGFIYLTRSVSIFTPFI